MKVFQAVERFIDAQSVIDIKSKEVKTIQKGSITKHRKHKNLIVAKSSKYSGYNVTLADSKTGEVAQIVK